MDLPSPALRHGLLLPGLPFFNGAAYLIFFSPFAFTVRPTAAGHLSIPVRLSGVAV
jgi:hypothetical protein